MQENKIITTMKKSFRHKILLEYDICKIDYEVKDFNIWTHIIGNSRLLVINASYNLYWKPICREKSKTNKITKFFKEIEYIDDLNLDCTSIKVESNMQIIPHVFQSNCRLGYALLIGEICCKIYTGEEVEQGKAEKIANEIGQSTVIDKEDLVKSTASEGEDEDKIDKIYKQNILEKIIKKREVINEIDGQTRDIICISSTRWDFIWQRPHQLMERLSKKNNRVLFFNHSIPMAYNDIHEILLTPELWGKRLSKVSDNLWIFSSVHLLKNQIDLLTDTSSLESFNYKIKESALKFLIKKLQFKDPIIISYLAESVNYVKNIPRKLLCYDCVDNFSAFSWANKNLELDEKELIKEADLVITTAESLFNRIKKLHSQTILLPNAVDYRHFAIDNISDKYSRFKDSPTIGFIGAFYEWVDEELIEYLAKNRKGWQFQFIGPVQPGMGNKISKLGNVIFFGIQEYKILPEFLSKMDVCIIPFKLNKITESANPIKLWEYMASGIPIVSTPIPEIKKFEDVVYLGDTRENFLLKVEEALQESSVDKRLYRKTIAQKNDWNFRVNKLLKIINENVKSKDFINSFSY